jgi:hypothetical protein
MTSALTGPSRAQTRPETLTRARTRTMATLDATERRCAPSPHASPHSAHAPVASPRYPLPPRQPHWLARALSPSPRTTTIRHGRQGAKTMTSAIGPRFHHHHALQLRHDVACTRASAPVPLRPPTVVTMIDRTMPRCPPSPAIKADLPVLNSPHQSCSPPSSQAPRLLALLD